MTELIELVAVSEGFFYNAQMGNYLDSTLEEDHPERPRETAKYEFYNVLCVEWEDGVAYRKGVGRVHKEAWERQDVEWIDLMMG